jgi:hypothetical protein
VKRSRDRGSALVGAALIAALAGIVTSVWWSWTPCRGGDCPQDSAEKVVAHERDAAVEGALDSRESITGDTPHEAGDARDGGTRGDAPLEAAIGASEDAADPLFDPLGSRSNESEIVEEPPLESQRPRQPVVDPDEQKPARGVPADEERPAVSGPAAPATPPRSAAAAAPAAPEQSAAAASQGDESLPATAAASHGDGTRHASAATSHGDDTRPATAVEGGEAGATDAAPVVAPRVPAAAASERRDQRGPQATPASARDLSGWWMLTNEVESTSYSPFQGLRLGYRVRLDQTGSRLVGEGEKRWENGVALPPARRTPISFEGRREGETVSLRFTESGERRTSRGVFTLQLAPDGKQMAGSFSSTAASSAGSSIARRVD